MWYFAPLSAAAMFIVNDWLWPRLFRVSANVDNDSNPLIAKLLLTC